GIRDFHVTGVQTCALPILQLNLGRVGGYTLAGAIVGTFGHGLQGVLREPWIGIALRVLVGAALVVLALRLLGVRALPAILSRPEIGRASCRERGQTSVGAA